MRAALAALIVAAALAGPAQAQRGPAGARSSPGASRPAQPRRGLVTPAELAAARAALAPARPPAPRVPVRTLAARAAGPHVVVSIAQRKLRWMDGRRVLFETPVAVGKGGSLAYRGRTWRFVTPRGVRRVIAKDTSPVWIPPEWHYVELARDSALTLVRLDRARPVRLDDGSLLVVRGDRVGRLLPGGRFDPVPADEEVAFGDVLYMPPVGTVNRRIVGELGRYKLDMGDGYLIHGTPDASSIGRPTTHGCIRVPDAALRYLFRVVPVGTPVYIY